LFRFKFCEEAGIGIVAEYRREFQNIETTYAIRNTKLRRCERIVDALGWLRLLEEERVVESVPLQLGIDTGAMWVVEKSLIMMIESGENDGI